jgi:parallel beta-helix repeat protein
MNSSENLIHDNLVSECEFGIRLEDNSSDNEISGCKLENVTTALALLNSASGNRIYENNIRGATDGVAIISSESNMLSFNQIMSCDSGIIIGDSSRNVLEDNNQTDVLFGLTVDGALPESFDNSIALSNTIDGRPILYCYDQSEVDILGGEYAHMTLAKCNNCKVEGNTITNDALLLYVSENNSIEKNDITGCYGGIRLQDSRGNKIRDNYVCFNMFSGAFLVTSDFNQISENAFDDNKNGIYLVNSSGNLIGDNTINRNKETGILLSNSSLNIVSSNTVDLNEIRGIHLTTSDANEIFNNTVSNSPTGIEITGSTENKIYNNNLAANGVQAVDDTGNIWDLGATEGGNFWSDHECSGNPSAGQPKAIGDLAVDSYPFQDIFGWILPKPT